MRWLFCSTRDPSRSHTEDTRLTGHEAATELASGLRATSVTARRARNRFGVEAPGSYHPQKRCARVAVGVVFAAGVRRARGERKRGEPTSQDIDVIYPTLWCLVSVTDSLTAVIFRIFWGVRWRFSVIVIHQKNIQLFPGRRSPRTVHRDSTRMILALLHVCLWRRGRALH